jgi:hypothetical protein
MVFEALVGVMVEKALRITLKREFLRLFWIFQLLIAPHLRLWHLQLLSPGLC